MSTLAVGTIKSTSSAAPVFQNTSGTEKGQLAKAWVNFDGDGTVTIRDNFNVSSITDNGSGDYTINFASSFSNNDYCCVIQHSIDPHNGTSHGVTYIYSESEQTTSAIRMKNMNPSASSQGIDKEVVCAAIFGDN